MYVLAPSLSQFVQVEKYWGQVTPFPHKVSHYTLPLYIHSVTLPQTSRQSTPRAAKAQTWRSPTNYTKRDVWRRWKKRWRQLVILAFPSWSRPQRVAVGRASGRQSVRITSLHSLGRWVLDLWLLLCFLFLVFSLLYLVVIFVLVIHVVRLVYLMGMYFFRFLVFSAFNFVLICLFKFFL